MQPEWMMRAGLAGFVLLAACTPVPPASDSPVLIPETENQACRAAEFQNLIGRDPGTVRLPSGLNVRFVGPDMLVTADHVPTRMNVWVGRNDRIDRVYCG